MLMKKLGRYLGAIGLLLLMGVVTSCIKDDIATTETGTANITVNISSRSGEVDDDNSEVFTTEDIKTIRLILVQNGKVVSNSKHSFTALDGQKLLEQGIRIVGVKKAATDFYAVVNEANVNKNFESDFKVGTTFDGSAFSQVQLIAYSSFNSANGLPMVGCETKPSLSDGDEVMIKVTRAVARIDLTIFNKTGSVLDVNQINFGKFFPDNGFLLETPGSEKIFYSPKSFPVNNMKIATASNQSFSCYLYESLHGESYTVGMVGSNNYDLAPIVDNTTHQTISSLPRNTILKVNATANPTGWELLCNVLPWQKDEVNVNFKDNLSYVSKGWDKNTILGELEGNIVHVDPLKEALLTFIIQTPNTATWKAQLIGDQEDMKAFEFVGENSGVVHYDGEGRPLPQELKVRISEDYKESQEEHLVTLKVFAEIAGKEYELDLTNPSDTPQKPSEGQSVSRYTLLQKK